MRRTLLMGPLVAAFLACAPIAGGPPPTSIPMGSKHEAGLSTTLGAQIACQGPSCSPSISAIYPEQNLWYRQRIDEQSELHLMGGGLLSGGVISYISAGYRRYFPSEANQPKVGLDVKFGGFYVAEVGVPISYKLDEEPIWLTVHPAVGSNPFGMVNVPVGIVWEPRTEFRISTLLGVRAIGDNPTLIYGNAGLSFPF